MGDFEFRNLQKARIESKLLPVSAQIYIHFQPKIVKHFCHFGQILHQFTVDLRAILSAVRVYRTL